MQGGPLHARLGPLSFGGAPIGNLGHAISDEQARATVDAAWGAGVRYFDTAPHYGLGLSERRLGAALGGRPRDEYMISTKVGRLLEPAAGGGRDDEGFDVPATHTRVRDYSRDGVLRSLEASLRRLGLDRVDIVLVHDPDEHYRQALDGALPALDELRAQGVIGAYGAGMNQSAMLTEFVRHTDLDAVLVAGRYTLLDRSAEDDLLPACQERGVAVIAGGVFNSGVLATERPGPGATYDYAPAPPPILARAAELATICEARGVPLPAAAVQFPLRHPAVATVCLGAHTAEQVRRNAHLLEVPVPDALWAELQVRPPAE